MHRTTFKISKMDCPSEEQMIRMKLDGITEIKSMEFDLGGRLLHIIHSGDYDRIFQILDSLKFDTSVISTGPAGNLVVAESKGLEKKTLLTVLIINLAFFAIASITGLISYSMGLVADSLDMLADSVVYGLALFAVGGSVALKKKISKSAGYFQIILALIGFIEVIRRFTGVEKMPDFRIMIIVSILALIANIICLYLLQRTGSKEVHMRATMIFTSNDIIINSGVIIAGLLVNWLHTGYPDLIIGAVIFVIVTRGALRILRLSD